MWEKRRLIREKTRRKNEKEGNRKTKRERDLIIETRTVVKHSIIYRRRNI